MVWFKKIFERIINEKILNHTGADDGKITTQNFGWFVPQYTTSVQENANLFSCVFPKAVTELPQNGTAVFSKDVNAQIS